MINQQRRDDKRHYKVYRFDLDKGRISSIKQTQQNDELYNPSKHGFYRRVNVSSFHFNQSKISSSQAFEDNFQINFEDTDQNPGKRFKSRRLYNVYEKEDPIFKNYTETQESFIDYQSSYSSFVAELGLLDKIMIQSIFLTRNITKNGCYEYFIRRNGEYYLECIDDIIPVDGRHQEPLWGLSYNCPWELLLLKAWIKEKGGLAGVLRAEPGEFLYAFGLPGYSVKNIKKQLDFLKKQNSQADLKRRKQEKLPLNKPNFNIFAKTRSESKIQELGLIKNCLGYKIFPIKPSKSMVAGKSSERTIYKVRSTVPSKWIGSLSIINKNEHLKDYDFSRNPFNLEKEFLCTEEEILSIFSKFYLVKDTFDAYGSNCVYQDSYIMDNALKDTPYVYRLNVLEEGFFNLNIEHRQSSKVSQFVKGYDRDRWPYIKYFLAQIDPKTLNNKSKIFSEHGIPGEFEPNLFKYKYYDIEFMKGYHRSINRMMKIERGEYLIYVKIENLHKGVPQIDYTLNISSAAKFEELHPKEMSPFELRELVDSTIFDYSKYHGERYVRSSTQYLYLGNTFKEIGFGFMSMEVRDNAQMKEASKVEDKDKRKSSADEKRKGSSIVASQQELGIRILPGKFNKLTLAGYYYQERDGSRSKLENSREPITMIGSLGNPKIIVLENPNYDFKITDEFPEPGSIEVYSMKKKKL